MNFCIIKILDGIFISNTAVLNDYDFLFNNKVSHVISWLPDFPHHNKTLQNFQEIGIKLVVLQDSLHNFPISDHLKQSTQAIEQSKQEFLCSLIFTQQIIDTLPFVIAYLEKRFLWNRQTCTSFIEKKLALQNIQGLQMKIRQLNDHNSSLQAFQATLKIRINLQWDYISLQQYSTDDEEERVLINTMKNSLQKMEKGTRHETKTKKGKRVYWGDSGKNSLNAGKRLFLNSKINNSLKKNSSSPVLNICPFIAHAPLIKEEKVLKCSESLPLSTKNACHKLERTTSAKKKVCSRRISKEREQQKQDFDYLSLKQLSRTNFDDFKMKQSRLRKKQNITTKNQYQLYSKNRLSKKKNIFLDKQNRNYGHFSQSWKHLDCTPKQL